MIFFVTTDPAPITTLLHISIGKMVAFEPMETLSPIIVLTHFDLSPVSYTHLDVYKRQALDKVADLIFCFQVD